MYGTYGGCVPSKLLIRSAEVAETIKYEQVGGPYFFNQQNLAHKGKKLWLSSGCFSSQTL